MNIWMKLGLIILLMFIPIVSLLYFFVSAKQEAITAAKHERAGVEYLVPLRHLFEHIPQHRGLSSAQLAGGLQAKDRIQALQAAIAKDWQAVEAVDQRLGKQFGTTDKVTALSQRWREIQQRWADRKAEQNFEEHSRLVAELMLLMEHVAERSQLLLDPEVASYYFMIAVVQTLPEAIESLATLRGQGMGILSRQASLLEEQVQLRILSSQVQKSMAAFSRTMEAVYKVRPELEKKLAPVVAQAFDSTKNFLTTTEAQILQTDQFTMAAANYFAAGTEAVNHFFALYDNTLENLKGQIQARLSAQQTARNVQIFIAIGLTALAVVIGLFVSGLINKQITAISELLSQLGMGNYEARAVALSEDELGTMASSLNVMLDNTLALIQSQEERDALQGSMMKLLEEVADVAEGDLTVEAEVTDDATGAIADSFNYMINQLRTVVAQVKDATIQVSASAHEIQTTAEHLAHGSEEQATQIVDSSAALDEMSVSIQQVSENATLSASVAEQALDNARQGATAVQNTIEGMHRIRTQVQETAKRIKRLGERSQEIGEIVQLIGDIADRTSILALNASIQAARAGEAGRAFTVVAEEVERLAERSSDATKQIAGLVNTIQSETNEAVTAMEESTREVVQGSRLADQAGQALGEIEGVSGRLSDLIQSISLASQQQARGSENLSKAMGEISDVTQQTAAGTKQAAVSINNLAVLADELRGSVSTFKLPAPNGQGYDRKAA